MKILDSKEPEQPELGRNDDSEMDLKNWKEEIGENVVTYLNLNRRHRRN